MCPWVGCSATSAEKKVETDLLKYSLDLWNLQDSSFSSSGELVVNSHSSAYNGIALLDVPIDLSDFSSID